jgi:hypothetical protein
MILLAVFPLMAQSKNGLTPVDGLENWKYDLDLGSYAPGKYNLVIEAKDKSGNVTRPEPMNVYVDPKADLPIISIINPYSLMRVGGNLNIVGTCSAPKGVDHVEISLDKGDWSSAEGGEFWSLYLQTSGIPEGRRTIRVRGIDKNGLVGPVVQVQFDLDKTLPLTTIEKPAMGSLVAAEVKISGNVFSANGVRSLEISQDSGKNWAKADLRYGKDKQRPSFTYAVDTKKLPDGPKVFSLRSSDMLGLVSASAFIMFIDNAKPTIELARPSKGDSVYGIFTVAGAARHSMGVKRLSYEFNSGEKGEIPLTKGDPFFAKDFDADKVKGGVAIITLIAEDPIGNIARQTYSYKIDREAEKPVLKVLGPKATGPAPAKGEAPLVVLREGEPVWGSIASPVGAAGFRWSLDGGAASKVDCSEVFSLVLPPAVSGRHVLSLVPVDVNGLAGNPTAFAFSLDKGPGAVTFDRITSAKATRDFAQGAQTSVDAGEFLEGAAKPANPILSASYAIAGGQPKPLALTPDAKGGPARFRIPLDRSLPYGFAPIEVVVKDTAGGSYSVKALLYVTDYGIAREETGFRFSDSRLGSDGQIAFGPKSADGAAAPVLGAFYGGDLASLRLDPPTDLVTATFQGRVVSIAPVKDGMSAPTKLVGTTSKGHEFSAGPFVFVTDSTPPDLQIDAPAQGTWFKGSIKVNGKAVDAGGGSVDISWRRLPDGASGKANAKPDGSFSIALAASDMGAGAFSLEVTASDSGGNASRACLSLGADPDPPKLTFLSPEAGSDVWGPEYVAASIDGAAPIASVEFASDGKTFAAIDTAGRYFVHRADLAANPKAAYRVTDAAGNIVVARPDVKIASAPTRPNAALSVAVDTAPGEAKVELSGGSAAQKISLSLPGLAQADFDALGDPAAAPPARFATRLLVAGILALKGQATLDGAQLKAISFSPDGATFQALASNKDAKTAKSSLAFALNLDASKLQDGLGRWVIKVEDFAGDSFLCPVYCFVDAKAPVLTAVYPDKGVSAMPGPFPLVIKAEDAAGLASGEILQGTAKSDLGVDSGGRYFAFIVDPTAPALKGQPVPVAVSAADPAGNRGALSLKYSYDAVADTPKIRLDALVPDAKGAVAPVAQLSLISGLATDDDGPPSMTVSIDGGDAQTFVTGAFALELPALKAGKHSLVIQAGSAGFGTAKLSRDFTVTGDSPAFGDFKIGDAKDSQSWSPGADFVLGPTSSLMGSVNAPNGLASLTVSVNGTSTPVVLGKAVPGAPEPFTAAIPASMPYDRLTIAVSAKDALGVATAVSLELHKILPPSAGSDDAEGVRFADSRIVSDDSSKSFLLAPGDKLVGRFNGRPIKGVSIAPAAPALGASFDGSSVTIEAAAEGLVRSATLSVETVDGDTYVWGPFSASIDADPPALQLDAPADNDWDQDKVQVKGTASDPQGIALFQVSIDGADPVVLYDGSGAKGGKSAAFDKSISMADSPDGATRLDFVVRDGAGRETKVTRFINKDTQPPVLTQVEPAVGEKVNGLTTFVVQASDAGRLSAANFLSAGGAKPEDVAGLSAISHDLDLARLDLPLAAGGGFVVTDKAGNQAVLAPSVVVDKEADKPIVEIHSPSEMEILRGDFIISGVAYDDDGVAAVYYRIDGGEWVKLDMPGAGFAVPIALKDTTDNEHVVEAKAEDIYGVQGDIVARKYRISKEEPAAVMTGPPISKPVRGTVKLVGTASDANGIKEVKVSVDNRTSYDGPAGKESWSINLDTTTLSDGIHAVAVRPIDGYDTEGFYASMITVDNTPPKTQLDLPRDGDEVSGIMSVSGRLSDNLAVAASRIEVAPVGANAPPALVVDLKNVKIVHQDVDISSLKPGEYRVRIVVLDRADNETIASRDVVVVGSAPADSVSLVFPVEGENPSGKLRVEGRASVAAGAGPVSILADGNELGQATPDPQGWYSLVLAVDTLSDGAHVLKARTAGSGGTQIESPETHIQWTSLGPWVSIDSLASGKYLPYRPYLRGKAGWVAESAPVGDKKALEEYKKAARLREVKSVEISLDDGRTYLSARGGADWSYRLETQNYKEGPMHVIVRSHYADGSSAMVKALFFLDKTPPKVEVLTPALDGRYNQVINITGSASDENGLESVSVGLRKGDKAMYEVPSFIQGLYLDGQVLGATTWEAGVGLTFFGDNVKLQADYGKAPTTDSSGEAESFYGDVFGAKLVANLFYLPFESILGPDWSFLSTSIGVGADFSYFTQTQAGKGLLVGSVFGQLEFPKFTLSGLGAFNKYSLYMEYQFWALSSVVSGGFISKASVGARIGVF